MPSQQQETLEMISNLKKALHREKEREKSPPNLLCVLWTASANISPHQLPLPCLSTVFRIEATSSRRARIKYISVPWPIQMVRSHTNRYASPRGNAVWQGAAKDSRQKIEHAGYSRYILERNPARYNDYGDELSNFDSEEEPDTHAEEIDPYEGIRLEGIPFLPGRAKHD